MLPQALQLPAGALSELIYHGHTAVGDGSAADASLALYKLIGLDSRPANDAPAVPARGCGVSPAIAHAVTDCDILECRPQTD